MIHICRVIDNRFKSSEYFGLRFKIQLIKTAFDTAIEFKVLLNLNLKNPMHKLNSISYSCSFVFCSLVSILYTFNFHHNKLSWYQRKRWPKLRRQHLFTSIPNILHQSQVIFFWFSYLWSKKYLLNSSNCGNKKADMEKSRRFPSIANCCLFNYYLYHNFTWFSSLKLQPIWWWLAVAVQWVGYHWHYHCFDRTHRRYRPVSFRSVKCRGLDRLQRLEHLPAIAYAESP